MAEITHYDILNMVQRLDPGEQLQLLEKLAAVIRKQYAAKKKHSLLDLQGLGKEIWQGVNPGQYIQEERESWNG